MSSDRHLYICIGQAGSGKTHHLALMLRRRLAQLGAAGRYPVTLIHDERMRQAGGWSPSCIGLLAPERCRLESPDDLGEKLPGHVVSFYQCEAEHVARLAWQIGKGTRDGVVLVVDELDRLGCPLPPDSSAYRAVHHGRGFGIDVFGTARRWANVDKGIVTQATGAAVFRMVGAGHLDVAVIRASGWPNADSIAAQINRLQDYHYLDPFEGSSLDKGVGQ